MTIWYVVPPDGDELSVGRSAKPAKDVVMNGSIQDTGGNAVTPEELANVRDEAIREAESIGTEGVSLVVDKDENTLRLRSIAAADSSIEVSVDVDNNIKIKTTGSAVAGAINFTSDNGTNVLLAGAKAYIQVPYKATITGWEMVADLVGSIEVDVLKCVFADFPPSVADSIVGGNYPALVAVDKAQGTPTGWTTLINAGDYLQLYIRSVAAIKKVTFTIKVTKG